MDKLVKKRERSLVETYKYNTALINTIIILITALVITLAYINININYKESMLVNILGRQRMLTQMMAKDTARIYFLNSLIQVQNYDKTELEATRSKTIKELASALQDYRTQTNNIKNGYIVINNKTIAFKEAVNTLKPTIIKHAELWNEFEKACETILNKDNNSLEFLQAMNFIDENNDQLLAYSDSITQSVLEYNKHKNFTVFFVVLGFIIIMLGFLIFFIIRAYKNLFKPIGQIYKRMSKLGISKESLPNLQEEEAFALEFSEIKTVFSQLNKLILLIENLNKNIPFNDILKYIFESFSEYIPYTHIGVALISDDKKYIKASYAISRDQHKELASKLTGYEVPIYSTSLRHIIETGEMRIINDLEKYVSGKPLKEYNKMLLDDGIRASITFPLMTSNEVVGIIFFSSDTKNVYNQEHIAFLRTLANSIGLCLEKNIIMEELVISSTTALANLTEERDEDTGEHLGRMSIYSKMLAEFLSMEEKYKNIIDVEYIKNIERFSPLHDIGKVAIRDDILLKPGKLTREEFEIMKTHTTYGGKVLRRAEQNINKKGRSIFKVAIEIAEGHHEKWDGSGYPYGKKGGEIPLSARIVALADVFDALTSKRPYKDPFSFDQSIRIINEGSGKHFDPELVKVFMDNIDIIERTYLGFQSRAV